MPQSFLPASSAFEATAFERLISESGTSGTDSGVFPPAVQSLALDDGREILIADIQIHIAVDTCNLALLRMLPDAVSTAVVGLVHPVRQPDRVPRLDIIGSMCGQRRSRAVQPDKVTRALKLFKERTHDIITTPLRIMRKFIFLQNQDNTQVYFERTTV